jgi:hypothetical protein
MNVQHVDAPASTSLMPKCVQPYLEAVENIGIVIRNATQTCVVASEAALMAAELSKSMIELRLNEVASQLSTRPALT